MMDIIDAILTIFDAFRFGKEGDTGAKHHNKWSLIGAGLILFAGVMFLVFAVVLLISNQ